jgi:hypothetical protein
MTKGKAATTHMNERSFLQEGFLSGMIIAALDTIETNCFQVDIEAFQNVLKNVVFLSL